MPIFPLPRVPCQPTNRHLLVLSVGAGVLPASFGRVVAIIIYRAPRGTLPQSAVLTSRSASPTPHSSSCSGIRNNWPAVRDPAWGCKGRSPTTGVGERLHIQRRRPSNGSSRSKALIHVGASYATTCHTRAARLPRFRMHGSPAGERPCVSPGGVDGYRSVRWTWPTSC